MCQELKPYMSIQREFRKEYRIDQSNESTAPYSVNADVKYRSQQITLLPALHF